MKSDAYRKGYSLESLRALELVPLTTKDAQNGTFIHDSLKTLFRILNNGFPEFEPGTGGTERLGGQMLQAGDMWVDALNSPLFDDSRLELLRNVRFRNHVLQQVLQLLSLSAEKKKKVRGRISYAELGINQLGAVYEGILSYTGFFATEDLYEVASEKDCEQLSGKPAAEREALKTYFVSASRIGEYREGEIVKDESGRKVVHKKGTFIFRLAGRNREKSASYYTPEVLTRCLVKYALKELLSEEGEEGEKPRRKKTADEILALTICEPAMGSSAFLIEAVNQLADAYLEARQEERGETIPPEDYQREKHRVKARLATNNCYGVDLNPTAVELAKTSLWLATLHEGGKCPWFGLRLATGNSLVGARREVFKTVDVTRKGTKDASNWLKLVPEPVPLYHGEDGPPGNENWEHWTPPPRPKGTIYHFLLPAEGMAAFDEDKVIKQLAPESVKRIKQWRKEFCKPLAKTEAERLEQISDAVDRLFAQVVRERVLATQETSDRIPVWGEDVAKEGGPTRIELLVRDQEEVAVALEHRSSAHRRLKLAMDAWCALWFWPISEASLLPDRATWLAQLELILKGQVTYEPKYEQQNLLDSLPGAQMRLALPKWQPGQYEPHHEASAERLERLQALSDAFRERRTHYFEECGLADIDAVIESDPTLRAAQGVADRHHFHHWPLRFAEVFATRGGFDLILGNPPWVLLSFDEGGVLADFDASIATRKLSASEIAILRAEQLDKPPARRAYLEEFEIQDGSQSFLSALQNYPLLVGMKTNLYKCFITRAWSNESSEGLAAFLHPEGVYDDPRGGVLRTALYSRLAGHYQFINELRLFPEVHHLVKFSINTYRGSPVQDIRARHISSLFHPSTLDGSMVHDARGAVPGIKDAEDQWDLRPHRNRLVDVDEDRLALFASLYDAPGTPALEARLPVVHSEEIVRVLQRFTEMPHKLGDLEGEYFTTQHWNETNSQKDGTIRRETRFPAEASQWIIQGPHFYVGTPLNKTPNEGCSHNLDYTAIDLAAIREDYLPRTNYLPDCGAAEYTARIPKWEDQAVSDRYRLAFRNMMTATGERTLVSTIIPKRAAHIHGVLSVGVEDPRRLAVLAAMSFSVPVDFFFKSTGKQNLGDNGPRVLPLPKFDALEELVLSRTAGLVCLTTHFAELWESLYTPEWRQARLTSRDCRNCWPAGTKSHWSVECAIRSDLERRQGLLEIDVLSAIGLGLSPADLLTIYRVQFPVLQQYERERLYDQHGRIVPTSKTAAGNPAASLVELAATLKEQAGFDVHAEYHPDGSNTRELRKQKVRLGKREADVLGLSDRCIMSDLLVETEVRWSDEDHPEGRPARLVGLRYTDPGLEPRMQRVYPTPWTRCDREADYRQAWTEFERRLGKKMPEGTPL